MPLSQRQRTERTPERRHTHTYTRTQLCTHAHTHARAQTHSPVKKEEWNTTIVLWSANCCLFTNPRGTERVAFNMIYIGITLASNLLPPTKCCLHRRKQDYMKGMSQFIGYALFVVFRSSRFATRFTMVVNNMFLSVLIDAYRLPSRALCFCFCFLGWI